MPTPTHHPIGDPLEDVTAFLTPTVIDIVERIDVEEFTTVEFIDVLQTDDAARDAYETALRMWPDHDPQIAKMVIHGQAIPQILRESGLVEWAGFAHGEPDPYAVPAWWRKTRSSTH
jgi:hypothetical protein